MTAANDSNELFVPLGATPYDQLACMMWTDSHGWMARARHPNAKYHAAPDRSLDGAVRAALAAAPTVDDCGDLF